MNTTLNAIVASERIDEFVRAADERRRRGRPRLPGRARWRGHPADTRAGSPTGAASARLRAGASTAATMPRA